MEEKMTTQKKTEEEYEPFGEEWEAHLTKLPKKHLIDLYRKICIKQQESNRLEKLVSNVNDRLSELEIKRIALEIEKGFAQKYSWLFKQILDTYGRDSIKTITRYFVGELSHLKKNVPKENKW